MTDQEFLEALYSGLLERPADATGLADHLAWLEQQQADPKRFVTPASQADVLPLRAQRAQADWLRVELDVTAPSHGTSFPSAADNRLLNTFLRSFQVNPAPQRGV